METGIVGVDYGTVTVTKDGSVTLEMDVNEMLALANMLLIAVNRISDTKFKVGHD